MKRQLITVCALAFSVAVCAAPQAVRNPFWPADYQGESSPISAEVRVRPKPKTVTPPATALAKEPETELTAKDAAAEAAKRKEVEEAAAKARAAEEAEAAKPKVVPPEKWLAARRTLKIGSPAVFRMANGATRASININGHVYVDGDLISVNYEGCRFTWRVAGIADACSTLKLIRVRARFLDNVPAGNPAQKGPSK